MGAPEKLPPVSNLMQRVKVYRLNDDGKWDDQGTGHVTVDYLERSEELGLFVIDEEDNETLLVHRISSDDIYRKQEDTIISWRDADFSSELALSFQENTGCSYIWDNICNVQRTLHFSSLNNEAYHTANIELRELPAVELSTLPLILKTVVESSISEQLRVTELVLHDQDFLRKLMALFRTCEDLENVDGLHMMYKIVRGIILLNSPQIFEKIFGDELIMDIIGLLEYEPGVPHVHHRSFLKEHVVFKEAIPIKDPLVLSKIHQTYRVGYLKDVILPRVLDDHTTASLNSIVHSNNAAVVSMLKDDSTFIQELIAKLRSATTSPDSKKNLVFFLQEFCSLSKSLQMVQQLRLFRDLVNEGIFDIIADILQSPDKKLVLTGTDILILFLNQDPNLLRSYVTRQEGVPLLGLLVKGMLTDFGDDMHCQFLEIIRSLLDSYTSGGQRDTIIEIFYEKHLGQLVDVITSSCSANGDVRASGKSTSLTRISCLGGQSSVKPEILVNICDLLCFCVLHHPYRIKCNFMLNGVIDRVLFLTRRKEKYLVVAAVRFVRTLISRNDEHLMSHIVKNNILKPIIDAFVDNGSRYNLLNSAVLELFEYIRKENLKTLVKYLVESFWDQLVNFEYLSSIQSLKVRYEQSLENMGTKNGPNMLDSRKRIDERALEKEEEDYFNEESDEEDSASASTPRTISARVQPSLSNGSTASYPSVRSGGLVDYEDDEDDEDYKPPPRKQSALSSKDSKDEERPDPSQKRKLASKEEPELREAEDNKQPPRKQRGMLHNEEVEHAELERLAKRKPLILKEEPEVQDDEDYKPPPKKQNSIWPNEGVDDLVLPKRKLATSKEEPELLKKQRLGKSSKSKESVFASLCSTLSHAVLPTKKTTVVQLNGPHSPGSNKSKDEGNHEEKGSEGDPGNINCSSNVRNPVDNGSVASNCSLDGNHTTSVLDNMHTPENRQCGGDDCPLIPPKSSPETAVNGS